MIVHTHVRKTKLSTMPSHINKVKGLNLAERKQVLVKQLAAIDGLLACTKDSNARNALNSSRNMIVEALNFCDAQAMRANPSYL
jgi:hypothetical protein